MNTNSNKYIFIYSVIMVVVVAFVIAFIATQLKPRQQKNIEIEKKRNILSTIHVESTTENAEQLFSKHVVDMFSVNVAGEIIKGTNPLYCDKKAEFTKPAPQRELPVFVAKSADGNTKYIIPLLGKGLWGPISGYVCLNEDMKTVYGAIFMHKSETPGLGAEISTSWYQAQFDGKQIYDSTGNFTSVRVVKGGADKSDKHAVDAITGGTITSNGLNEMLFDGLKQYDSYFKKMANK
ncbi:MAG TPA: NADH:ubiquinone reductase (Na(+)-transporting) subunit C [Bacteroidales bacterium]|nr:NADH:ubiquinone reductase (Na(+)-transporting) subunit C [Bacteroidales bacterium]